MGSSLKGDLKMYYEINFEGVKGIRKYNRLFQAYIINHQMIILFVPDYIKFYRKSQNYNNAMQLFSQNKEI